MDFFSRDYATTTKFCLVIKLDVRKFLHGRPRMPTRDLFAVAHLLVLLRLVIVLAGESETYSCYGPSSIIKYQGTYSSQGSAADTSSLAAPISTMAVSQSCWSRPVGYARPVISISILFISEYFFPQFRTRLRNDLYCVKWDVKL